MRIEYKKEWMDTYLWVLPDHPVEESYEERMIQHNPGAGRLEFSREEKDGETYFCYKVTGKKALSSVYAVLSIGERQIRELLVQLFKTLEEGKEFLLAEEDFVLSPNYIFATLPRMTWEFCYVPGYQVALKEQLEGLFEYLLNRVDYEDKRAVNLLYDCYMFCMKEKGGLAEIKKLLEKEKPAPPVQVEKPPEQVITEPENSGKKQETVSAQKSAGPSYVSWLTEKIFPRKRREPAMVAEAKEEYRAEKPQPAAVLDTDRTVLLSALQRQAGPELVCEQTGEVIPLTKFPFYVGSTQEYADYVPRAEGVSRIHCCISKKGDNFYLSDLNSTNGTYLNGKEISPGKEVLLSANDEIRITSQDFYMKFPCH